MMSNKSGAMHFIDPPYDINRQILVGLLLSLNWIDLRQGKLILDYNHLHVR